MREGEPEYWDSVARKVFTEDGFNDNWMKRRMLGQFLLKSGWIGQDVLEIGIGCAATASLLIFACGNQWNYIGTDVSSTFVEAAKKLNLKAVQTDILNLPEGPFTRILALDSLEHVHPEDRPQGYTEIARRLVNGGLLFINMPCDESHHNAQFDHGITLKDILMLEERGLKLIKYDHYGVSHGNFNRTYNFVVMTK